MPVTRRDLPPGTLPQTCSACGRPGHKATTCRLPPAPWDKWGIEIEGYWSDLSAAKYLAAEITGSRGCSDGSLDGEEGNAWEFQTRPGSIGEAVRQLSRLYPDFTDEDCGMHVHVSFRDPSTVSLLQCQEFFDFWYNSWEEWGARRGIHRESPFWTRLNGDNNYCQSPKPFNGHASWVSTGFRYSQINFTAWRDHRTVEFRLLPMFRYLWVGVDAVLHLSSILDEWVTQCDASELVPETRVEITPEAPGAIDLEYPVDLPTGGEDMFMEHEFPVITEPVVLGMTRIPRAYLAAYLRAQGIDL